MICEGSCDTED